MKNSLPEHLIFMRNANENYQKIFHKKRFFVVAGETLLLRNAYK